MLSGISFILADAGPQITDVDTGVWASVIMLLLFVAVGILLWRFFVRYQRSSKLAREQKFAQENNNLTNYSSQ